MKCPKCPAARKVVREAAKELGWKEGQDFVEKIIDGSEVTPKKTELEGDNYNLVISKDDIKDVPAALVGEDYSIEALMYQIASTPAIVIGEEAVFISNTPSKEELIKEIKERI